MVMPVKLQKEHVSLSEVLCSQYCRTTAESDIIVPDVKPDILKILRVSGEISVSQKNIQTDRVYVQGTIRLNILYIPDGETIGKVKAIDAVQDFSHQLDIKGAKPEMQLSVDAECEQPDYTLINSRKLNVRTKIGLGIKITVPTELDIATDTDGNEAVQTRARKLRLCCFESETERDIVIREHFELADGKPDIGEVLHIGAVPRFSEVKTMNGSAALKGEVGICVLYGAMDETSSVQFAEFSAPFNEIFKSDGIVEGTDAEVEYSIKDISCEILTDSGGEKRIFGIDITVCATLKASGFIELNAISDAYGLKNEIIMEKSVHRPEQLIDSAVISCSLKETAPVPDSLPGIYRVCDCKATPSIESISIDNGCVTVSGFVTCGVLCLPEEGDVPIAAFSHTIPLSHVFEIPSIDGNAVCDVRSEIEHIGFNIVSARDIELRVTVKICLKAVSRDEIEIIDSVSESADTDAVQLPSMIIYFVQNGDTLWDIAKRYKTTPDSIIENNGKESEILTPGKRIYIFR